MSVGSCGSFGYSLTPNHLFVSQGKYAEAGLLYERSQAIREKALGPEHPDVANSLNNRALLLYQQVKILRKPEKMWWCPVDVAVHNNRADRGMAICHCFPLNLLRSAGLFKPKVTVAVVTYLETTVTFDTSHLECLHTCVIRFVYILAGSFPVHCVFCGKPVFTRKCRSLPSAHLPTT